MELHKTTKHNLATSTFVAGTIAVSAGIYALLRGEVVDGWSLIMAGLGTSGYSVKVLIRLESTGVNPRTASLITNQR